MLITLPVLDEYKFGYPYHNEYDDIFDINYLVEKLNLVPGTTQYNTYNDFKLRMKDYDSSVVKYTELLKEYRDSFVGIKKLDDEIKLSKEEISNNEKLINGNLEDEELISQKLDYYNLSLDKVNLEITESTNLKTFYESLIPENIQETKDIELINNLIGEHNQSITYYEEQLDEELKNFNQLLIEKNDYTYINILIKEVYEDWLRQQNTTLIDLFKPYYDEFWTVGKKLQYEDLIKKIDAGEYKVNTINEKLKEEENFIFELQTELIEADDNISKLEKINTLITERITELNNKLNDNQRVISLLLPANIEDDYNKYIELAHEKIKLIMLKQDTSVLDEEISGLELSYLIAMKAKSSVEYLRAENENSRFQEEIKTLQLMFDSNLKAIERLKSSIDLTTIDFDAIKAKIEELTDNLIQLEKDKQTLNDMIEYLLKEKGNLDEQISLLKSKNEVLEQEINEKQSTVLNSLSQFFEDELITTGTMNEQLLFFNNNELQIIAGLKNDLVELKENRTICLMKDLFDKLTTYYTNLNEELEQDYHSFYTEILSLDSMSVNRVDIKTVELNNTLKELYARLIKFQLTNEYDENLYNDISMYKAKISEQVDSLKLEHFNSIKVVLDMVNYDLAELTENDLDTIIKYVDDVSNLYLEQNNDLLEKLNSLISMSKIDEFWNTIGEK